MSYAKNIANDYVETISGVREICKSLLPGAEGRAEREHKKTADDFIEEGWKYKARMKK
jgi:hypothetical protein